MMAIPAPAMCAIHRMVLVVSRMMLPVAMTQTHVTVSKPAQAEPVRREHRWFATTQTLAQLILAAVAPATSRQTATVVRWVMETQANAVAVFAPAQLDRYWILKAYAK